MKLVLDKLAFSLVILVGKWHMNVITGYKIVDGGHTALLAHDPEEVEWTRIEYRKLESELNRISKGKTDLLRIAKKSQASV